MARPRAESPLVSVGVRLPAEVVAEIDRRAAKVDQKRTEWLRDQLIRALTPGGPQPDRQTPTGRGREVTPIPKGRP